MLSYFLKDVTLWLTPSIVENLTKPNKYVFTNINIKILNDRWRFESYKSTKKQLRCL